MKLYRLIALFSGLLGICAGVLRWMELQTGYTADGFAVPGNKYRLILIIIAALALLIIAFFSVFMSISEKRKRPEIFLSLPKSIRILYFVSAAAFGSAGILRLIGSLSPLELTGFIDSLLLIFSAISMIVMGLSLRRGDLEMSSGIPVLFPVFWGCYHLILSFRVDTRNPVIAAYIWRVLAFCILLLCLFYYAGMIYGRKPVRKLYAVSSGLLFGGSMLLIENVLSLYIAFSAGKTEYYITYAVPALIFFGGVMFAIYCIASILRNKIKV